MAQCSPITFSTNTLIDIILCGNPKKLVVNVSKFAESVLKKRGVAHTMEYIQILQFEKFSYQALFFSTIFQLIIKNTRIEVSDAMRMINIFLK